MIPRTLVGSILKTQKPGFINLIYGPRRVGKSVLLQQLVDSVGKPGVSFNGDHEESRQALSQTSQIALRQLVKDSDAVYIDEAQRIPNIGLSLKILIDTFPDKIFYVTGSSALVLAHGLQETLTGRTHKYRLFPLSTQELTQSLPRHHAVTLLPSQLVFGGYPYLMQLATPQDKKAYLTSITDDYLFKDVLELKDIASPHNLKKLAQLLAFQIGHEVSFNELANNLGIDIKTVQRYLSLLKQSFVIFELGSLATNLRSEITKSKKYFFWDLGIRNALIDQFLPLDTRPDVGGIWENFLAVERMKKHEYQRILKHYYFWRTYEQAEVDWIEKEENSLFAYEFKWSKTKSHTPKLFRNTYHSAIQTISRENYFEFVT